MPASASRRAASALAQRAKLPRFLGYRKLELSNKFAGNVMRGTTLSRKNWIHVRTAQAGPKVPAVLSVVEICRRLRA